MILHSASLTRGKNRDFFTKLNFSQSVLNLEPPNQIHSNYSKLKDLSNDICKSSPLFKVKVTVTLKTVKNWEKCTFLDFIVIFLGETMGPKVTKPDIVVV